MTPETESASEGGSSEGGDPRSMREFDYFNEGAKPAGWDELGELDDLPATMEEQLADFHKRQRRQTRFLVLMFLTLGVSIWFLLGYRDNIVYAFSTPAEPQELGEVTEFRPHDIPHNAYVSIEGITEHRGMAQSFMRGLSFGRDEYWYFRLVGSRGVFIETPPDKKRFAITTRVKVQGRAVDPRRETVYGRLLNNYVEEFLAKPSESVRIIQVDVRPKDGRGPYILAFLLVAALAASNFYSLSRLLKARRNKPGGGILRS